MRLNTKHSKKPANAYDLSLDHNKCSYSHNTKQNTLQMFFLNRKILCKFSDVEKNAKKKNASKKTTEFISVALMRRSSIFLYTFEIKYLAFQTSPGATGALLHPHKRGSLWSPAARGSFALPHKLYRPRCVLRIPGKEINKIYEVTQIWQVLCQVSWRLKTQPGR